MFCLHERHCHPPPNCPSREAAGLRRLPLSLSPHLRPATNPEDCRTVSLVRLHCAALLRRSPNCHRSLESAPLALASLLPRQFPHEQPDQCSSPAPNCPRYPLFKTLLPLLPQDKAQLFGAGEAMRPFGPRSRQMSQVLDLLEPLPCTEGPTTSSPRVRQLMAMFSLWTCIDRH